MRQVPRYAVIGNGRMAKHMLHYFHFLGLAAAQWSRQKNSTQELAELVSQSTHVLILIADSAIDSFIEQNQLHQYENAVLVHFSGSVISKYAYGVHPLQTFGSHLYSEKDYLSIAFICEKRNLAFSKLLPQLQNPHYEIPVASKIYYHSLCVMANNFSMLLWRKFFTEMSNHFDIPQDATQPFLIKTFENIFINEQQNLTGPLARNDKLTLLNNLNSLKNDNHYAIFKAFVDIYYQESVDENCT